MKASAVLMFALVLLWPAAATVANPELGDIGLSGTVSGEAPTEPAVITRPTDGQRFNTSQITVEGTCPASGAFIHIFRNDVFAGSTVCSNNEFSLVITLLPGENRLVARVFSADNQPGPDSETVRVHLDVPAPDPAPDPADPSRAEEAILPLLVLTEPIYPGGFVNRQLGITVEILGGQQPYAVSVDWDDGGSDLLVRQQDGEFNLDHVYTEAGTYKIAISVSDKDNRKASIQTIAIVSGEPVRVDVESFVERHAKNLWVRIIGAILLIVITYIAGLVTGLKIVGDEIKKNHKP